MLHVSDDSRTADRLWADYARTGDPRTREQIILQFQRLAYSLANRFARRGAENEDLFQVALMGLVKAVDRFDPSTHHRFSTFATPTILGELRRYFRDHCWALHVPRGMQELSQQAGRLQQSMTERLGRTPTAAEIADTLQAPVERVEEALRLNETSRPLSLDGEMDSGDTGRPAFLDQALGTEEPGLRRVDDRLSVDQAMAHLDANQQRMVQLRYFQGLSQREVARELGLSQMQVSRMEKRAMGALRQQFAIH